MAKQGPRRNQPTLYDLFHKDPFAGKGFACKFRNRAARQKIRHCGFISSDMFPYLVFIHKIKGCSVFFCQINSI